MTHDPLKTLMDDYAALRAPADLDARIRAQHGAALTARGSRLKRAYLALAAGVVAAALVAAWLAPEPARIRTAETPPRISTALPSLSSLSVTRPKIDASARRAPPSLKVRTLPRPPTPRPSKEKRHVQS
ncbi:MAG: hypothetical protein AAFU65_01400 [Pseudomonadota bacterium]